MKLVEALVALVALLGLAASALAQSYPTRPVRVIVGFTPGGVVDITTRIISPRLADYWGQPVVVENRPGATGVIGANLVARSPPDGYTLLVHGGYAENAALHGNLPYDPLQDLVGIAPLAVQPFVLVASPASGVKTVAELIAAAKARPGQLNYGSAGVGSGTHLSAERFKVAVGIDAVHVPYKGGADAITNTIAGRITYGFSTITVTLPHIREGRLVALGVSSARRSNLLPDVPTVAEAGVPGFAHTYWTGVWGPAGTPADRVDRIARDVARALAAIDVRERLASLGAEPMSMTPAEFERFVRSEIEETARVVKAAGIKPQ
jgi:tripartite-type tricarboxylate transporter receptor subunit TctC